MSTTYSSHIDLAHAYWKTHVQEGDSVIDATCGNGHDTLFLAQLVGNSGRVIGLDIQEQALKNTQLLLQENSCMQVSLHRQSHVSFPEEAYQRPISLIVYNLGYLPGGNKNITTKTDSSLESLRKSIELVEEGGLVSVTCYPGHEEGKIEEIALLDWLQTLSPLSFAICHHRWINRRQAPSLLIIKKYLNKNV